MSAAPLLARLEGVRQTGAGRWIGRCPAHADKSPSLSIRELDDGRVLLHDFAGCAAADVLAAVGLAWGDILPPREGGRHSTRKGPPVPYADALRCIEAEAWVVLICAGRLEMGEPLESYELGRLTKSVDRIHEAARVTGLFR